LNRGLYCFLVVVIELFLSMTPPNFNLLPGLKSWDHYNAGTTLPILNASYLQAYPGAWRQALATAAQGRG
jgi:hypothetical protein